MTDTHELVLFHDGASVAAAIGALLTEESSVDDVSARYEVDPDTVTRTIGALGLEDQIAADLPESSVDQQQRVPPPFLDNYDPITRQRRGIRDDVTRQYVSDTYEIPFRRAILSEAGQRAQNTIKQSLTEEFGFRRRPPLSRGARRPHHS